MPMPILMPALSPTMEEGRLAKWLVKVGDVVKPGSVIAEIETDKATMEVEAIDEGVVDAILVAAGTDKVRVNTPIALLRMEGEVAVATPPRAQTIAPPTFAPPTPQGPPPIMAAPAMAAPVLAPMRTVPPVVAPSDRAPSDRAPSDRAPINTAVMGQANGTAVGHSAERAFISPLASRLARDAGLDVASLKGSGPHGRIVLRDVEVAAAGRGLARSSAVGSTAGFATTSPSTLPPLPRSPTAGAPVVERAVAAVASTAPARSLSGASTMPAPPTSAPPMISPMADDKILALYDKAAYEVVPHDGMRRIIAERLTQSKSTVPHFYLSVDVRLDTLLSARERLNARSPKEGPRAYKLSVNDFVIKALALALMDVPAANATWTTEGMLRHRHADVGVAVAVEGGLFTPVIKHAELKTLAEISNEMKDMAERARKRRLAPHEYQGGTTSISNLGMFGIRSFDAVINPPHATILAVGAGEKRPIVVKDVIEVATMMTATLSCDHRVVDGALGAELLNAFKSFIEDPVRMLV
jgi:pyruvate dehydrogenase E2 component (dihydrolipoamide acetyltransferase)